MAARNSVVEKKTLSKRAKAQRQAIKEFIASSNCIARAGTNKNNGGYDRSQ